MTGRPDRLPVRPPAAPADGHDVLSDVLHNVRLSGALFFQVKASAPWAVAVMDGATLAPVLTPGAQVVCSYHVVTDGRAWAALSGRPPVELAEGDVLVIPNGDAYAIATAPELRPTPDLGFFRAAAAGELPSVIRDGDGRGLGLLCGFLGMDARPFNPLLAALPPLLRVGLAPAPDTDRLSHLIAFALAECSEARAGGRTVLLRLSELLFVEVVRRYVATLSAHETGWLAGLRDPLVGRALDSLHRRPARRWTLQGLAREAGTSRSVLAERFAHFVGEPPMRYLARWRIQLAARLLREGPASVASAAADVGYESEAAFSRAFKRLTGMPPSAWAGKQHSS